MSTNGKATLAPNGNAPPVQNGVPNGKATVAGGLVRVMVVDPQPCFSEGLRALLNFFHKGADVVATSTSLSAVRSIGDLKLDVLIADSELVGEDDWKFVAKICDVVPPLRVIILATTIDPSHVAKAFSHGVMGYLDKDISSEDLVHAIRLAKGGRVVTSPLVVETILNRQREGDRELTEQERVVLTHVAKGLDNDEIARLVALSASTLKRTLQKAIAKLNAENRIQAAVIATRNGLI